MNDFQSWSFRTKRGICFYRLMHMKQFYVYILSRKSRTLYVGVTSDLIKRVYQHKYKLLSGFSSKYNIDRLVYYEEFNDPLSAIEREKQIKAWTRAKKIALIETINQT